MAHRVDPSGNGWSWALPSQHAQLRWRIVLLLLLVSLLPLALVSLGAWRTLGGLLEDASFGHQRTIVENHAEAIDSYLAERLRVLELTTRNHSLEDLTANDGLQQVFDSLSATYGQTFVDLGVIDSQGRHLAYVGPYELMDRDYHAAEWFQMVRSTGSYVSDVFMGYRQVPHCVIAVKRDEGEGWWILRATINSDNFDALVRSGAIGETGDSFIVNSQGLYQTPPRVGQVLERSPLETPRVHRGVQENRLEEQGLFRVTSWINDERWMLVVQQDTSEVVAPRHRALAWGGLVILLGVVLVAVATSLATRHLTGEIERAEARRDELSRDLMRSAKLASLGELASGLAHEINNPLAIISVEQTNIADLVEMLDGGDPNRDELLASVRTCKRQVQRCGGITAKMLQFGRQADSCPVSVEVAAAVDEVVTLLQKQAQIRNVLLQHIQENPLPEAVIDPTELQQVLVNLINNALYATKQGGRITVTTRVEGDELHIEVCDTGTGIEPEVLDRIFQPFFTTKPVGEGTGLGLPVCFGIVRGWGGDIDARSEVGEGTVISIRIPVKKTQSHRPGLAGVHRHEGSRNETEGKENPSASGGRRG